MSWEGRTGALKRLVVVTARGVERLRMGQPGAAKGKRKYKNNKDIQKKFRSKRRTRDHDQIRSDSELESLIIACFNHHTLSFMQPRGHFDTVIDIALVRTL